MTTQACKSMKAVVLISGSGSNLQAFIDQVANDQLPLDISLVISNVADVYGLQRAQKADIAHQVVDHTHYESRLEFDQALIRLIDARQPDLVVLAGFMRILTTEFVEHYHRRLLNIHPSLLPDYAGSNTHQRALDAGEKWHGASVHFVVPEVDAGPIIIRGRLPVTKDDTASSLQQRVHRIEHQIYPLAVKWFVQQRLTIVDQQVLLDGELSTKQLQSYEL